MNEKWKNRIVTCTMALLLLFLSLSCYLKKPDDYSASERRELSSLPALSFDTILSGTFMKEFETYAADQFPLRDSFRSLKTAVDLGVFCQLDSHQLYLEDGYLVKMEYPADEQAINASVNHFLQLYRTYLSEKDGGIYFAVIPDKNYYLAKKHGALSMDYDRLIGDLEEQMSFAQFIDLTGVLSIEDYYRTDSHWRQERLPDTASLLLDAMGISIRTDYTLHTLDQPFYGVYSGQLPVLVNPDTLSYLTSPVLDACTVTGYASLSPQKMELYDLTKASGKDPYDLYLSGAQPLLVIENPIRENGRELILFRDSFGSSIAPLLAEGYAKITVVDTRYVSGSLLGELIDFEDQDILFLYSTTMLNNGLAFRWQ
ncbi:MAG: DHHW family protein [Fusicatenibacter sp.]|nr:DHHW family protein [Fusicatenibacter sp.]